MEMEMEMCSRACSRFRLTWVWGTRLGCEETRCKAGSSEGLKKVPGKKITPPISTALDVQQTILILETVSVVATSQDGMWLSAPIQKIY